MAASISRSTGIDWASDLKVYEDWPRDYYSLPAAVMHELGHTAGLGLSGRFDDIMGYPLDKEWLPVGDREAMKALYEVRTRH